MPTNSSVLWHAIACEQALRGELRAVREGRESSPESPGAKGSEHEKTVRGEGGGGGATLLSERLEQATEELASSLSGRHACKCTKTRNNGTQLPEHSGKSPKNLVIQGLSRGCKFVFTPLT